MATPSAGATPERHCSGDPTQSQLQEPAPMRLQGLQGPQPERMFNRLKQFRRIATPFDKTAKLFAAFLALAAARIWMPHFVNRT
jgi:hypothetical protein